MYQKLVVGVDFTEKSNRAVRAAIGLSRAIAGSEVVLVHAAPTAGPKDVSEETSGDLVTTLEHRLKAEAAELSKTHGVNVDYGVVEGAAPAEALLDYVKRWGGELVVVGTAQHSTLNRLLVGSVAESVMHKSPVPVIVIGPSFQG